MLNLIKFSLFIFIGFILTQNVYNVDPSENILEVKSINTSNETVAVENGLNLRNIKQETTTENNEDDDYYDDDDDDYENKDKPKVDPLKDEYMYEDEYDEEEEEEKEETEQGPNSKMIIRNLYLENKDSDSNGADLSLEEKLLAGEPYMGHKAVEQQNSNIKYYITIPLLAICLSIVVLSVVLYRRKNKNKNRVISKLPKKVIYKEVSQQDQEEKNSPTMECV
jgi:cytochrome oxidase assembly protein ShyY1